MMMLWLSCLLIGSITCRPLDKVSGSERPAAAVPAVPNTGLYYPGFLWSPGRVGSSSPGSSSSQPMPGSSEASQPSAHVHSSAGPGNLRDEHYNPTFGGYAASHSSGLGGSYGGSASGYGASGLGGSYGGYGASGLGGSYGGYGDSGLGGSYGGSASGYGDSGLGGSYGGYGDSGLGGSYGGYGDSGLGGSYGGGYGSSASGYAGASYGHDESSSSGSAVSTGAGIENPEPVFSDVSDLEPVSFYSSRSSYQRGQEVFAQTRYTPEEPVPPFPLSSHSSKATHQPSAPAKAPTKGGF